MKNVAGYDLARMLCGSLGSLAVITSATFKLAPLAPVSRTVVATARNARACADLALAVSASPTAPSAIEVESPPHRLLIRFESTARAADAQADAAASLCLRSAAPTPGWWPTTRNARCGAARTDGLGRRDRRCAGQGQRSADRGRASCWIRPGATLAAGRAALGVLYLRADGVAEAPEWLDQLRLRARRRGGSAVVVQASPALEGRLDVWGELPGSRSLMRAVKARFDPNNILNPGGGPGGL